MKSDRTNGSGAGKGTSGRPTRLLPFLSLLTIVVALLVTIVPAPWQHAVLFRIGLFGTSESGTVHIKLRFGAYATSGPSNELLGPQLKGDGQVLAIFRADDLSRAPNVTILVYPSKMLNPETLGASELQFPWGKAMILTAEGAVSSLTGGRGNGWVPIWLPEQKIFLVTKDARFLNDLLQISRQEANG